MSGRVSQELRIQSERDGKSEMVSAERHYQQELFDNTNGLW